MPDFEMPDEASEGRGGMARLPRGRRARRLVAIGVTAVVLATLAIVGVPALVEQQRGRDAVAVVERYAASVADGDVDAVVAASPPDTAEASGALLRTGALAPTVAFAVDHVELLDVQGARVEVRVRHAIGPDSGASVVALVDRGGEWRIVEGLLGVVDVPDALALALGDADAEGPTWMLPGRYGLEPVLLGVVEAHSTPFVVVPGERVDALVRASPTMEASSVGIAAVRAFIEEFRATCGETCPLLGAETDVPPQLDWELDLSTRTGTMTATITTMGPSAVADAMGPLTASFVAFDVMIADDLQSLTVTPADPVIAP